MSVSPLYLTESEKKMFSSLSAEVQNGWTVESENLPIEDSPERMRIRLELMRLHDPVLQELQNKAASMQSADDVANLIGDASLEHVSDDSLAELFFALGPVVLTKLIEGVLAEVKTDEDLSKIEALTGIRHSLLLSRS